jgi:hypothetical protein
MYFSSHMCNLELNKKDLKAEGGTVGNWMLDGE